MTGVSTRIRQSIRVGARVHKGRSICKSLEPSFPTGWPKYGRTIIVKSEFPSSRSTPLYLFIYLFFYLPTGENLLIYNK